MLFIRSVIQHHALSFDFGSGTVLTAKHKKTNETCSLAMRKLQSYDNEASYRTCFPGA